MANSARAWATPSLVPSAARSVLLPLLLLLLPLLGGAVAGATSLAGRLGTVDPLIALQVRLSAAAIGRRRASTDKA
jgi:hypothetical protein